MGFFQNLRNRFARFMYGRNGMDQLNQAVFWLYIALWVLCGFILPALELKLLTALGNLLMYGVMFLFFFRVFSKNLYQRREENQKWISWWWRVKSRHSGAKSRHADKEHKYFTCRTCKTICRVPVGKGKIVITCPKCGAQIQAKT